MLWTADEARSERDSVAHPDRLAEPLERNRVARLWTADELYRARALGEPVAALSVAKALGRLVVRRSPLNNYE